jgi:hypothetical protein
MKLPRGYLILLAVLVMFSSVSAKHRQENREDPKRFPSTGHQVSGEFLDFYYSVDDPDRLFGDPITEVVPDPIRVNILNQYFERVRMDYDPSKPVGQRVSLADLGTWLYDETQRGLPVNLQVNTPLCRHFPKTDKYVCFGFLQFYDRHNGEKIFGEPVSDVEFVNNRLVQYFEHVRLEWRNEMPVNQKVVLTEIGRIGFDLWQDNPKLLDRVFIPNVPIAPVVKAFVAHPLLAAGGQQEINIIVRDQFFRPIPDSQIELTVIYPNKDKIHLRVNQPTDSDGLTHTTFAVDKISPNQVVEIEVTAQTPGGRECSGRTWFRIWW